MGQMDGAGEFGQLRQSVRNFLGAENNKVG
jgi:hypothetical protein